MLDSGPSLPPFSVAYVKGWRRSTTFLGVLAAIKALEINVEELPLPLRDRA